MSFEEVALLCADCDIRYEMRCRNILPELYTVEGRRNWWAKQLKKEANVDPSTLQLKSYLEPNKDLEQCSKLLEEFETDLNVGNEGYLEALMVRLGFLCIRIKRIESTSHDDIGLKTNLSSKAQSLLEKVESIQYRNWKANIIRGNAEPKTKDASSLGEKLAQVRLEDDELLFNIEADNIPSASKRSLDESHAQIQKPLPQPLSESYRKAPAMYKWGLKYSGDNTDSASEFLQRVADYSRSRQVTENEILLGMTDLLEGSALRWYRRKRDDLFTYQEFVEAFLKKFEPSFQTDRLLDFLRTRKQSPSEGVIQFVSYMEDQFLRLPHVPSERTRIKIIRNNLLPHYIRAIALLDFDTVEKLEETCRKIEISESLAKDNTTLNPFRSNNLTSLPNQSNNYNRFASKSFNTFPRNNQISNQNRYNISNWQQTNNRPQQTISNSRNNSNVDHINTNNSNRYGNYTYQATGNNIQSRTSPHPQMNTQTRHNSYETQTQRYQPQRYNRNYQNTRNSVGINCIGQDIGHNLTSHQMEEESSTNNYASPLSNSENGQTTYQAPFVPPQQESSENDIGATLPWVGAALDNQDPHPYPQTDDNQ